LPGEERRRTVVGEKAIGNLTAMSEHTFAGVKEKDSLILSESFYTAIDGSKGGKGPEGTMKMKVGTKGVSPLKKSQWWEGESRPR